MRWPDFIRYEGRLAKEAWIPTWEFTKRHILVSLAYPPIIFFVVWLLSLKCTPIRSAVEGQLMPDYILFLAAAIAGGGLAIAVLVRNLFLAPVRADQRAKADIQDIARQRDAALERIAAKPLPILVVSDPQPRHDGTWYLKVRNDGEPADVRVQVVLLEASDLVTNIRQNYTANWENYDDETRRLANGEVRTVGVAERHSAMTNVFHYTLLFWDETRRQLSGFNTEGWVVHGDRVEGSPVKLRITFIAEPTPDGGAPIIEYYLDHQGLHVSS